MAKSRSPYEPEGLRSFNDKVRSRRGCYEPDDMKKITDKTKTTSTEAEIHGLMDRGDHSGPFWESRDYGLPTIPCNVGECPACVNRKCTMPSAIIIDSDGRCQLGKKAREENAKKRKNNQD